MNWSAILSRLRDGFWKGWNTFVRFSRIFIVFLAAFGLLMMVLKPNKAQESYAKSIGLPIFEFMYDACELKDRCDKQREIKLSCAAAGDIDRCIEIKMQGTTPDENCTLNSSPTSPAARQCLLPQISHFLVGQRKVSR